MRKLTRRIAALTLILVTLVMGSVRADVVQRGASAVTMAAVMEGGTSGDTMVDQNSVGTAEIAVSQNGTAVVQATTAAASHGSGASSDAAKVVTNTFSGGDEFMLVTPRSASQMVSSTVTTKAGRVLVFDDSIEHDTEHLKEVLRAKGGHVTAWFTTCPLYISLSP